MRRVVSVWLPYWPTDRLRRRHSAVHCASHCAGSPESPLVTAPLVTAPLVTASHDGRRRAIAAADPAAAALGLRAGMAVAQALAIVPGLQVMEADAEADGESLLRLARWCHRATPLTAVDAPDGLWLDITGCAHLWGSETALLQALLDRLARDGVQARAAVAGTPGAAHAVARHRAGDGRAEVIAAGGESAAIAALPVAALRLAPELVTTLQRLGFEQIGHLARIPRALLARRFGPLPVLRLDQADGRVHEAIRPLAAEHVMQQRAAFLEPLLTAEALAMAIMHLMGPLCVEMERAGLGARQMDLLFERVDGHVVAIRIGTARASRDAGHLARLLNERLDRVDPGLGVEAMRLVVPLAEPLQWEQRDNGRAPQDMSRLVDCLSNRLGAERVYQASALESAIPERSIRHDFGELASSRLDEAAVEAAALPSRGLETVAALDGKREGRAPTPRDHLRLLQAGTVDAGLGDVRLGDPPLLGWRRPWALGRKPARSSGPRLAWPERLHAPSRLLDPPRPIEAIAALPDDPPVAFTWRRRRHRICRADGPERVQGEWWLRDAEQRLVRDYYRVEDESGQRFWLFREGNGLDSRTGDLSWYLHGLY